MNGKQIKQYISLGRRFVEGWLSTGACSMILALDDVQKYQAIRGHVAEIGVHHGRLFILLLLLTREDEKALAIDLFADQERNIDGSGEGDLAKLNRNIHRHAAPCADRVRISKGDSTQLDGERVQSLAGGPVRLFSIDGGHTADITFSDLVTAQSSMVPGGVVILDDCFNEGWPGVVSGLARFHGGPRYIRPFAIGGNKVLLTHPDFIPDYRAALQNVTARATEGELFGFPVLCLDFDWSSIVLRIRKTRFWAAIKDNQSGRGLKKLYGKARSLTG